MKVMKKFLLLLTIACMAVTLLCPITSEAAVKPKAKVTLSTTTYTYNGKTKKPSVKVKDSKGKTIKKSYYKVSYSSGRKNVGTYKVKVTFKKKYKGSITKTFKIIPKKTSLSSVKGTKSSITVKWKKQSKQTSGYQIQYTTDKKFKKGVKTTTVSSYKTASKTIKKLSTNKKYYVRIRTYKKVGRTKYYSGWSSAKSVNVGKPHTHKYTSSVTKQPTCTKTGIRTYKCSCGAKYTKSIRATGKHTWDKGKVTTQPTCTNKGVKTYTCTVCKKTKTESIAALGHDLKEEVITEPTCGNTGVKKVTCSRCDYNATKDIPATGNHTWNDGEITKEPSCTETGSKLVTCTECGHQETVSVPMVEHSWTEHPEEGHEEMTLVWEDHVVCKGCKTDFGFGPEADDAAIEHVATSGCYGPYHVTTVTIQDAYTSHDLVGYKCSTCGATK